jgi:hypothetical protein
MDKIFKITSGTMVCSDPCYQIPTWCQGVISNVKNGLWEAGIETLDAGTWGERISLLWVFNIDAVINDPTIKTRIEKYEGVELSFSGGVDSGQFGFFDLSHYRNDDSAKDLVKHNFGDNYDIENGDAWYRAMCHLTLDEPSWGVAPFGVVSSSGFGDGAYLVKGIKNDAGEFVAFCVQFIPNNWDTDDDYDDEDEDFEDEDED